MSRCPLVRLVRQGPLPTVLSLLLGAGGGWGTLAAQGAGEAPKRPLTIADYSRWRTIEGAQISPDGQWVAYTLRHTNVLPADSRPVVRLRRVDTGQDVEIADASNPVFSSDSKWMVYRLDSIPARRGERPAGDSGKAAGGAPPRPPRVELRELATGVTRSWERMSSAVFSPTASHLVLHRGAIPAGGRPAGAAGAAGGAAPGSSGAPGSDAVVYDLASRKALFLGRVGELSFSRAGDRLAYTVEATPSDANGLFVLELRSGRTIALDNDARSYSRIAWNEAGTSLAVLKGKAVEKQRERENHLLVFAGLGGSADPLPAPVVLDPAQAEGFPGGFVVSERAPITWSEDGKRVFFGILPQRAAPDTGRKPSTDSIADVDVWRTQDERIQSVQMIRADADRNFTFLEAFEIAGARFVRLADSTLRDIEIAPDGRWAVGRDARRYVSDWRPPAADFYRVDPATGERTLIAEGQLTGRHQLGISPDGRRFLYWKDGRYVSYDLDRGVAVPLAGAPGQFADPDWDYTGPAPPDGVAGFTRDGSGVIVSDRYDLWLLPLDGSPALRNLTRGEGARREIRLRVIRTEPLDSMAPRRVRTGREIDLSRPVLLSAFGEYTKQSGFFRLARGQLSELILADALFSPPVQAARADRLLLTRQTFREFPDLQVAGPDFRDIRRISEANPQQAEYAWGRRILFDYWTRDSVRLQGLLALPDDYQPGQRRPMLVNFYEKNSQNLHRYPAPSFLTGMGSLPVEALSRGYLLLLADVHFRTGSSHSDMLESVEAATRKVIEMGYADPARIGVHGHSYGGEGAAFIATRSGLFAAVGMGAGVTDLYSDFSQSWGWSYQVSGGSGENGSGYYLYGQGRWGFSPWDKPDVYRFESALSHAPEVRMPVLIMHGTADPTVAFSEGMNFYNALRFNGKTAYLLAYPGEGHGLRGLANRRDLTVRYFEFFDHYLKGAPAPRWMTDGVPYLVKTEAKPDSR
jgi:dipeptidyl aminopeptidase/acylaminoacyl peptidase